MSELAVEVTGQRPVLSAYVKQYLRDRLIERREYIRRYGEDMPGIRNRRRPQEHADRSR